MKPAVYLLVPALALLASCSKQPAARSAVTLPAAVVRVAPVVATDLATATELTGTVRPVQRATLAAKVMGTIARLPVTLGQQVAAGDLLVEISATEIEARVTQARAQFNAAQRDLERERALLAKGASTTDMVRGLQDRFEGAQAMLREAETMLGYTQLRAPFAGVIARKLVDAGDLAAPGQPLLQLDGMDGFQIEAAVPDSLVAPLSLGQPIAVLIPTTGRRFDAQIAEISSAADAAARSVSIKLSVPADAGVRSGQFARLALPGAAGRALLVPAEAVSRVGQMERVFVVGPEKRATLRLVKTGATRGDQIEILSGLDEGESVIVAPPGGLREGQPLEVRS
jgi:membrane fusion protein, multidrug efflux system